MLWWPSRNRSGFAVDDYQHALLSCFANLALRHRLIQIAMDGSQKISQRLLDPLAIQLSREADCEHLILAVAGWIRHLGGSDEQGRRYATEDPMAEQLIANGAFKESYLGKRYRQKSETLTQALAFIAEAASVGE